MVLQSLDRGLDALNILAKHDLVSVTELAKELGVDKSTASRIMETLRQHDMVQLDSGCCIWPNGSAADCRSSISRGRFCWKSAGNWGRAFIYAPIIRGWSM